MLALVHAEPLDVLADQLLHELEIVAAIGGRGEELRLEQAVESQQRRIARELFLDELACGRGSFVGQRQRENAC